MTYIQSPDGTMNYRRHRNLPVKHWEQTSDDPPAGVYHELNVDNAESFGYYELVEVAQPDADHVRTVENVGPGLGFTEVWTFDQDLADANADQADRNTEAEALRDDFQMLKDERDQAATARDDADLKRRQMLEGDPDYQRRWDPLPEDGTATNEDIAKMINRLVGGQRQQWGDLRVGFGNDRSLAAALVRKLRKDRDDE